MRLTNRQVKSILEKWAKEAHLPSRARVLFNNRANKLTIMTNYPGWLIGVHGNLVDKYKNIFNEANGEPIEIAFVEIDGWIWIKGE